MRILVFGGNGKLGKHVIPAALKRHDEIILFVRSAATVPDEIRTDKKVEIVLGDYANECDIRNVIISSKPDVIITATRLMKRGNGPFHESTVRTIVSTLSSINRLNNVSLIYVGGVLIGPNENPFNLSLFIKQFILLPVFAPLVGEANAVSDHKAAYHYLLNESPQDFNFVIVRPGKMKQILSQGNMIASDIASRSSTSFVDVASYLVECCHNTTIRTSRSCTYVNYNNNNSE